MSRSAAIALLTLLTLPAWGLDPGNAAADYARLQRWQFSAGVPLPGAVTLQRDTATWTLESGTVRLMEPASDGAVTGLVFEGKGRFRMTVPDRHELAQLRRFAGRRELAGIDEPFTQLVVRTSDPAVAALFPAGAAPFTAAPLAQKRHEFWLEQLRRDVDATIVAAMLNPGTASFVADTRTEEFDWLMYEYDSWRGEEITLTRHRAGHPESWVSLDRAEDRRPDGRPGQPADLAALVHVDVKADLTRRGSMGEVGRHHQRTINGGYVVEATYSGIAASLGALRLDLFSTAKDLTVTDASGASLTVLRDHIGKRSAAIENIVHDDDLVVILPAPLRTGEKQLLRFSYSWEGANYAPGGPWYPMVAETLPQLHTARLELTVHAKNEARGMGRMESRSEGKNSETTVWVIDRPTKMVTFATATRFEEVRVEPKGIPPVIAFGPDYQFDNRDKLRNVGADVANSMQFFQHLLGEPIETPQFYVTSIAGSHGQAFEGFLHMGEFTFSAEHPGASELFRAHEVAHEWFGHKVGWASYRDQWLSESLAEYAAMMFVQGFVKGGDKHFEEILRSYGGMVKGNLAGGFSKFNRPWLAVASMNASHRSRVGPIGHGWRANTAELPGYMLQSYFKGPLVLHMLRTILGTKTQSDELFVKILRDYVQVARGKRATTDDFRRIVERNVGGSWEAFFDSWIYGAEIPSYSWSYEVAPADGGFTISFDVKRRDASAAFMTIIPVKVEFEGDKHGYLFVISNQEKQTATFKVPLRPKKVIFAPDHSLLAEIRRE